MNNLDIYLISSEYIKSHSTIMSNVDEEIFQPAILAQQDIVIQKIMGSTLYDEMITQFENYDSYLNSGSTSGGTVSAVTDFVEARFITLVDKFIQPTLLYYCLFEMGYDLYSKITNKGVTVNNSVNSTPVDFVIIEKRRADWKNKGEYYAERMMNYLIDNQEIYPNFLKNTSGVSNIASRTSSNFFNGIYLGKGKRPCNRIDYE